MQVDERQNVFVKLKAAYGFSLLRRVFYFKNTDKVLNFCFIVPNDFIIPYSNNDIRDLDR